MLLLMMNIGCLNRLRILQMVHLFTIISGICNYIDQMVLFTPGILSHANCITRRVRNRCFPYAHREHRSFGVFQNQSRVFFRFNDLKSASDLFCHCIVAVHDILFKKF